MTPGGEGRGLTSAGVELSQQLYSWDQTKVGLDFWDQTKVLSADCQQQQQP